MGPLLGRKHDDPSECSQVEGGNLEIVTEANGHPG